MSILWRSLCLTFSFLCTGPASAWCLDGKSCSSDESVCDMGASTTRSLSAKTFVWSEAKREVEIYRRLASVEILNNCTDRQQLILQSDGALRFDKSILPEVARRFCRVADISTTAIPGRYPDAPGFAIKCVISKMAEARRFHDEQEAEVSTTRMIEEDNKGPAQRRTSSDSQVSSKQATGDCNKWSLGMVFGLPGRCAGQ